MAKDSALPTVSVVIPTSGQRALLREALAAALADPGSSEVVIVLDEPGGPSPVGDRLLDRLAATDSRVRTTRVPTDGEDLTTLQLARDAGTRFAASEVVLSLDDDVILDPGTVSGHARAHAEGNGQVVLGYMPVVSSERWPWSSATIRYYSESYEYHCECYEADPRAVLTQIWGGNFSVRQADWLRAIERPRLSAWGHDDQELGLLFLREGLQGRFERGLRGSHWYRRSLSAFVERAEKSPAGKAKLQAANPDLLSEPEQPGGSRQELISGPLLWLSRPDLGWMVVRSALMGMVAATGALKLRAVEDRATRFLWFLARERARRHGAA